MATKTPTLRNLLNEDKLRNLTFDETKFGQQIAQANIQPRLVYEAEQLARLILAAIRRWPQFTAWRVCPNVSTNLQDDSNRILTSIRRYIYNAHDIDVEYEFSGKQLIVRRKFAWDKHGITPDYEEKLLRAMGSHEGKKPYRHCPSKQYRGYFNLTAATKTLLEGKAIRIIDVILWLEDDTAKYAFEDDFYGTDTNEKCIDFIPVLSNYTIDQASVRKYSMPLEAQDEARKRAICLELIASIYESRAYQTGWSDADFTVLPGNYNRFQK